jgi:hypothetical protein
MRLRDHGRFGVALLALAIGIAGLPSAGWADDDNDNSESNKKDDTPATNRQTIVPAGSRPDLKIEYAGFSPPNLQHTVTFKVTNVGMAPSSPIKAQIQTLSGGSPSPATPDVPSLAPGQSHVLSYGIGTCNGHIVQATVNDPLDFPSVNDRAEAQACSATTAPANPILNRTNDPLAPIGAGGADLYETAKEAAEEAVVVGPSPIQIIPERMRSGMHEAPVINASSSSTYFDDYFRAGGNCGYYDKATFERGGYAGWLQRETYDYFLGIETRDCAYVAVAWLQVNFPYEHLELDDIPEKTITRAVLTFQEHQSVWRDQDGATGCITTLQYGGYIRSGAPTTSFLVTDQVAQQVAMDPVRRPFGSFTLRGAFGSTNDLQAEGSSSCLSRLDNVRLQVTYEVP